MGVDILAKLLFHTAGRGRRAGRHRRRWTRWSMVEVVECSLSRDGAEETYLRLAMAGRVAFQYHSDFRSH